MIDEDELRALLTEAAESVPPPGRAPQVLLDAIAAQTAVAPKRARPRPRRGQLVLAAAAAVTMVAIGLQLAGEAGRSSDDSGAAMDTAGEDSSDGGAEAPDDGSGLLETAGGGGTGSSSNDVGVPVPDAPASLAPSESGATGAVGQASDSAKVIRTGSVDLEVREGAFESTVDRITALTVGFGGYVAEATTSESSDSPSGAITVRVPGDDFEQLLADVRELGDVKGVSSKGTDVTAQFTDLEARLSALTATRDRLLTVLAEAETVNDILAVQDRITQVQIEIEQVKGEQKLLEDQTAFGTLAITLGEPGAEIIEVQQTGDGGLGGAWDDARRRFGDSLEAIVSWSGSAIVALAILLAGLLVFRFVWLAMRRRMV